MAFPDFEPSVPAMLRTLAERYGPRELLVVGEQRIRYAQAEAESALLARGLLAEGIGKGTRLGLLLPNGPEWVFAWLAAARIGALVVPLNTFSRARELRFVLRHADVDTLLTAGHFLSHDYLALLEECAPELAHGAREPLRLRELPYLRRVRVFGPCDRPWAREGPGRLRALAAETPGADAALLRAVEDGVTPADLLTLVYTSGSAADPKGVVLSHGTVVRHAHNLIPARGLRDGDRARVWNDLDAFEIMIKVAPGIRPGQVLVYHAWDNFQFKGQRGFQNLIPTPLNPVELAGGQFHLRPMTICLQPSHTDRDTRVEVERA